MIIKKILHKLLEIPIVFQLQQKICNNYDAVLNEFSEYLNTTKIWKNTIEFVIQNDTEYRDSYVIYQKKR